MPLPSPLYVAFQGLETYFVDKDTGFPLSGGYVEFYSDIDRNNPKDVYQQVQLPDNTYSFVNIGSTVQLTAVGTFQSPSDGTDIQVYAFPWEGTESNPGGVELYYLQVFSSGSILQFTREAQPANAHGDGGIITTTFESSDNIIENPQFVETFFNSTNTQTYTLSGAQETPIAPDWTIVTTGTGSFTATWEQLIDITMPTGAPYAINITNAGFDSISLRQRIDNSPRIVGQGFISSSLVAKTFSGTAVLLSMDYVASNGYIVNLVNQSTTADGAYTTLQNDSATPVSTTNASPPATGYVDIVITIPVGTSIGLTSIQVTSVQTEASNIEFLQESVPRQIDHLFHFYQQPLLFKPVPSYLTGWDFPLNPAQEFGSSFSPGATGANKGAYGWDQTIVFQEVNSSINGTRASDGSLAITPATTSKFALIQYLDAQYAKKILLNDLSVNINMASTQDVTVTASLWYTTNADVPVLYDTLITTLDANGHPSAVVAGWSEIARGGNAGNATFPVAAGATLENYGFNGWEPVPAAASTATFFAIVIGVSSVTNGETVKFQSVSLVPGKVPTIPAPQTRDEVLRECEFYYEKSYAQSDVPGSIAGGCLMAQQQAVIVAPGVNRYYIDTFGFPFKTQCRTIAPNVFLYSPVTGAVNGVSCTLVGWNGAVMAISTTQDTASSNWAESQKSSTAVSYEPLTGATIFTTGGISVTTNAWIYYHYVKDGRLGVV